MHNWSIYSWAGLGKNNDNNNNNNNNNDNDNNNTIIILITKFIRDNQNLFKQAFGGHCIHFQGYTINSVK